jgi:hypothetical protein
MISLSNPDETRGNEYGRAKIGTQTIRIPNLFGELQQQMKLGNGQGS